MKHKQKDPNKSAAYRVAAKMLLFFIPCFLGFFVYIIFGFFRIIIRIYRERELLLVDSPHGVYS